MDRPSPENPPDLYVVHTDRAALHRIHGRILVLHGVLALVLVVLIMVAGSFEIGWYSALPFVILLVGQIFQLSLQSFNYGARLAINEPLTLSPWGFAMNTPGGRVEMPWEAVTGLGLRKVFFTRALFLQPHPSAGPGSPGVRADLSDRYWNRIRHSGLMLGSKGIQQDLDEIAQAIRRFSGDRVRMSSPRSTES